MTVIMMQFIIAMRDKIPMRSSTKVYKSKIVRDSPFFARREIVLNMDDYLRRLNNF